jgi:hypothetical protein
MERDIADKGGIIPFMAELAAEAMLKETLSTKEGQAKFAELKKSFDKLFENQNNNG